MVNFFKPASKKEPEHTTWKVVDDTLLVGTYFNRASPNGTKPAAPDEKRRVAGFDLVREMSFRFLFIFSCVSSTFLGGGRCIRTAKGTECTVGFS